MEYPTALAIPPFRNNFQFKKHHQDVKMFVYLPQQVVWCLVLP
jgi:hypothetical protein